MRRSRISIPKPDALDKMIGWLSPEAGVRRLKAKTVMALYGGYTAARTDRRQTKAWQTMDGGADQVTLPDLPVLRERSHDLVRNAPLATGAINTVVTNVVGTGLKVQSRIDREVLAPYLGDSEEAFDAFERAAEREFRFWANSRDGDAARMLDFTGQQDLALRSVLVAGDAFILRRHINRPGARYSTAFQLVEAERVCNPNFSRDIPSLSGGVEKDEFGAAIAYHILQAHPGDVTNPASREWVRLRAQDKQGLWLVNHLARPTRIGMTRPAPYLAPVIESLKQLDKYSEAELMAAVISSMFSVFIKSEDPDGLAPMNDGGAAANREESDFQLGPGAILDLLPYESVEIADPKRPNTAFDGFVMAVLRQVGVALEIPFELLVKHFTASYSAAQAALLEAWKFFRARREWLASMYCQPMYEIVITEAVAKGYLHAPGFFSDPMIRAAYLGTEWIGPPRGQIDQLKEGKAARERVDMGISTLAEETASLTGGDWERKHQQRVKEKRLRVEAGLEGWLDEQSRVRSRYLTTHPDVEDDQDEENNEEEGE